MKELRDKAEKHTFQAEVDRMMKLIINSLYKNKEVRGIGIDFLSKIIERMRKILNGKGKMIIKEF